MHKSPSPRALGIAARVQAQLAGETRYRGQPCAKGHVERYANNGNCVQCTADRSTARRKALRKPTVAELQLQIDHLRTQLKAALAAEARAWGRVAELEDRYEPRLDTDLEHVAMEAAA